MSREDLPGTIPDSPVVESPRLLARAREAYRTSVRRIVALRRDHLFLVVAVLIGVFSGLAVVAFRMAIEWTHVVLLGSSLAPSSVRVLLVPSLCGILIALLVIHVFPRSRGSGVNQTKTAVYVSNGYIPFDTVIGKFIVCALAIGSGQSLGPEDPSLQMGAGIASALGRRLKLSQEKLRLIAPVGAAAGLAAAFNAPVSAVLFVIEEVIGTWSAGALGAIVLAAVSSVVTMRWFLGSEPLFHIPPSELAHPAELLAYAVLGVVGGGFALVFLKWISFARPRLQALPRRAQYLLPAAAGLLIGVIAIWLPQVMGAGYPIIDQALQGEYVWHVLLILAILKIAATGFSFLSGTPGGMFAPTLFIGAMLGGAVGGVESHFFPTLGGTAASFALVGMGTFFAGFLRTPITSIFMVVEVSGNYSMIVPVMISTLIAYLISRHFQKVPLFDLLTRQDGVILPSIEERRERVGLVVEDAMRTGAAITLDPAQPVASALRRADAQPDRPLLLRAQVGEWRLLDREELHRLASGAGSACTLAEAASKGPLPLIFPDELLEEVLRWAGDWPVLPVVSRADLGKLEGVLSLSDILRAFRNSAAE